MEKINDIEKKWQDYWLNNKCFKAVTGEKAIAVSFLQFISPEHYSEIDRQKSQYILFLPVMLLNFYPV